MRDDFPGPFRGYLVAILIVAAAALVRWLLDGLLADQLPFVTFLAGVLFCSWYAGLKSGILAAALGFFIAWYIFVPPRLTFIGLSGPHLIALVISLIVGLAIALFGEVMRKAQRRSKRDQVAAEEQRQKAASLGEVLHKRAEELDALLHMLPVGVFVAHDSDCREITVNPAGAEMLGIEPELNASKSGPGGERLPFKVYKDGAEVPQDQLPMQKAARTGKPVREEELEIRRSGGSSRILYEYAVPLFNPDKSLRGCLGAFVDITDRKLAELALRASEQRFRMLASEAPVGIFQTDAMGNCLFVNRRWCDLAGRDEEQAQGRGWLDALHPEDRERVGRSWYAAAGSGREFSAEYRFRTPQGKVAWLSGRACAIVGDDGALNGYIGTVTDISLRKRAERELRIVTDTMSALVALCGRDLQYRWVSKSFAEWYGLTAEEMIGRSIDKQLGAAAFTEPNAYLARVLAGEEVRFEEEIRIGEAGRRWVSAVYTPTYDEAGEVDGWVAVLIDIEERRRSEDRLRESEEQFRQIVETANEGIWTLDRQARITFVNRRMAEMLGYQPEEMIGRLKWDFLAEEDRERAYALFERRRAGISEQADVCFRHKTGRRLWAIMAARSIVDGRGEFQGSLDLFTDVTERKRAEETIRSLLRISERLNSTLEVDALLDILIQEAVNLVGAESGVSGLKTDEGMVCRRYFQKGKALPLEYCWPPMHGLPGWLLVHKVQYLTNDALGDRQIVRELCEQFGVRSALSTPIITAQGEVVGFFEVHNKNDEHGFTPFDREMLLAVSQAAAIAVQNALAYRTISDAQQSLQDADKRKDEFLATLAHELRNPLAPLRNGLQLLKLAGGNPEVAEQSHAIMERQLAQMVRLIDDLLDVSRINRGILQIQKERIALSAVIDIALETCRPVVSAEGHTLEVTLPEEPIYLYGDLTRLGQVFSNLLSNACKYTGPEGRIWISAKVRGGEVTVSVRDNGIGIPSRMLDRIFEMFAQVDHSLERSHGGLGIGLTIVRRLVDLHGGSVVARSEGTGKGSEFIVRLPLAPRDPREAGNGLCKETSALTVVPRRVLVADDNRDSAQSLALMLKLKGHEVRAAYDGQEAVTLAASYRPDVILLDIGMPKLNGYAAARFIREQHWGKGMVMIALTGWGQTEDKIKSREAGFDHHLVKPVEPSILEKLLVEDHLLR